MRTIIAQTTQVIIEVIEPEVQKGEYKEKID
jgi:hypothetical protein